MMLQAFFDERGEEQRLSTASMGWPENNSPDRFSKHFFIEIIIPPGGAGRNGCPAQVAGPTVPRASASRLVPSPRPTNIDWSKHARRGPGGALARSHWGECPRCAVFWSSPTGLLALAEEMPPDAGMGERILSSFDAGFSCSGAKCHTTCAPFVGLRVEFPSRSFCKESGSGSRPCEAECKKYNYRKMDEGLRRLNSENY
jgi:hypothetical protein